MKLRLWSCTISLALCPAVIPATASAQRGQDSLPAAGSITETESALYAAVRARPRDPQARVALGRYLVARGATRVGMTLLEEAIRFGADSGKVEPDLARAYLEAGDYRSLAALKFATRAERQRARWLVDHESRTISPDSIMLVPLLESSDSQSVGRITFRVNGHAIDARISSGVSGIVIPDSIAATANLHRFTGEADQGVVLGAVDSIGIGRLSVTNVPVTIRRTGTREAIIGLDLLGQFVPAFDPDARQITLHVGGARLILPSRTRFVTWRATSELQMLQSNGWTSMTRPQIVRLLRTHRWTFDSRRGLLVLEP